MQQQIQQYRGVYPGQMVRLIHHFLRIFTHIFGYENGALTILGVNFQALFHIAHYFPYIIAKCPFIPHKEGILGFKLA